MSDVKRYDLPGGFWVMVETKNGAYISFNQHQQLMNRLTAERDEAREALRHNNDLLSLIEGDYDHAWPNEESRTRIYREAILKQIRAQLNLKPESEVKPVDTLIQPSPLTSGPDVPSERAEPASADLSQGAISFPAPEPNVTAAETPRTDERIHWRDNTPVVDPELAKELERELTAAQSQITKLHEAYAQDWSECDDALEKAGIVMEGHPLDGRKTVPDGIAELAAARDALAREVAGLWEDKALLDYMEQNRLSVGHAHWVFSQGGQTVRDVLRAAEEAKP